MKTTAWIALFGVVAAGVYIGLNIYEWGEPGYILMHSFTGKESPTRDIEYVEATAGQTMGWKNFDNRYVDNPGVFTMHVHPRA